MVFAGNPTRPRKSKQPFQFWPAFEWFLQEIQQGHGNRSKLLDFDPVLKRFCRKSYQTTQIEATFQFWSVFEWFFQEIQLGYGNRNKLFNFDPFLNGFCKKCYQTTQIEATFSVLIRSWMAFARNPTRPCKSKQPFQFWSVYEWFFPRNPTGLRKSKQTFQIWPVFEWFL